MYEVKMMTMTTNKIQMIMNGEIITKYPYFFITAYKFQENLIRTMKQIEDTYFELADSCQHNCLVICDRGIMDASACKN